MKLVTFMIEILACTWFFSSCSSNLSYYTVDEKNKIQVQENELNNSIPFYYFPSNDKLVRFFIYFKGGYSSEFPLNKEHEQVFLQMLVVSLPNLKLVCNEDYDYSYCLLESPLATAYSSIAAFYKGLYATPQNQFLETTKQRLLNQFANAKAETKVKDRFDELFFKDHPYLLAKNDFFKSVDRLSTHTIYKAQKALLFSERMIIFYQGSQEIKSLQEFLNKTFGKINKGTYGDIKLPDIQKISLGKRVDYQDKTIANNIVGIRFALPSSTEISSGSFSMATTLLQGAIEEKLPKIPTIKKFIFKTYDYKQRFQDAVFECSNTEDAISLWDDVLVHAKKDIQSADVLNKLRANVLQSLHSHKPAEKYIMDIAHNYITYEQWLVSPLMEKSVQSATLLDITKALETIQMNQRVIFIGR